MTNLIRIWRSKYIYLFFIKIKNKIGTFQTHSQKNIYLTLKKKKFGGQVASPLGGDGGFDKLLVLKKLSK